MRKFRNIIVLGKSKKFINIISSIFPKSDIKVYSWRLLNKNLSKERTSKKFDDLIFICGYNYSSGIYSFKEYYNSNIKFPLNFIKKKSNKNSLIFYIGTAKNLKKNTIKKRYTLSRYEYAKKELAYKLSLNFKKLKILDLPIILNSKNEPFIRGGYLTKLIFSLFINFRLVKSIKISSIKNKILNKFNSKDKTKPSSLIPILLKMPRTLFLDRFMRIIL